MRRRSSSTRRRVPQDSFINMAQARREIVHALHLHRSSSSRTTSSSSSTSATILESMPIPEPIWSTTQPSIPVVAAPVVVAMEGFEFEWGSSENQASSYSWWLGFLKALDSKNNNNNINNNNIVDQNYSKYPCLERIHHLIGSGGQDPDFVDASHDHDQQNSSPDEWLMFPTNDDDHHNY
ncbi:hypothetical protein QYF36_023866 [Acer negundo]|nr:hypothetical protein QYF36_023866 [Acer negundo]